MDEPSFSVAYALMCKELAVMEVSGSDKNSEKQECSYTFKKLIINRCQKEFERNPVNEVARAAKLKEIEECIDPVSPINKYFCIVLYYTFLYFHYHQIVLYLKLGEEKRFAVTI